MDGSGHRLPAVLADEHPRLSPVFSLFDSLGHEWSLLDTSSTGLTTMVDVLLGSRPGPSMDTAMAEIGFHVVPGRGRSPVRSYASYGLDSGRWLRIVMSVELAFGDRGQWVSALAPKCLERRVRVEDAFALQPRDTLWLDLLHLFADHAVVPARGIARARETASRASASDALDSPCATFVDTCGGAGSAARLLDVVLRGSDADVQAQAELLRRWLAAGSADGRTSPRSARTRPASTAPPRDRFQGLTVAVMGPDGAGKTTLLQGLAADFPLPSKYVYMGLWSPGRHDDLLRRIPGGRVSQKTWKIIRSSLTTVYHRSRGRLVVLDRIAYDTKLPGATGSSLGGRLISALALTLSPTPDVLFVLDAPGEVMFARKGEHSVEVLEGWRQAYLQMAEELKGTHVLDATRSADEVRRTAVEVVWRKFAQTNPGRPRHLPVKPASGEAA
jgi:thymidylate kinase